MLSARLRFLLLGVLGAILAGLLFVPGLGGSFLLDDESTITDNPAIQITSLDGGGLTRAAYSYAAGGGTRPLPMATFAIDYWRAGMDPRAFKTTNILIHILTTLALACFFRSLLTAAGWTPQRAVYAAPALALAWAIHPMQVSSVLYVVQRMQTMGTLFLVLALWAYLKMRRAQIVGERSRHYGILTGLAWVLALASKEDSILFPAYTLAMELTVLRFHAAQPGLAKGLRRGYLFATLVGAAALLLGVLPHYWSSGPYHYRDFSSIERLLTQGRVLAMYLGQILLPLPSRLPFYYDDLIISRSWLQPVSTLPALLLICGTLLLAWRLRARRPLFALGVLLFFAGHFITSNVLNLELAFEHRNQFPLIGAVLAIGDLLADAFTRLRLHRRFAVGTCAIVLLALGGMTLLRAQTWGSPLDFARESSRIAPLSERAWTTLCRTNFELSGGKPGNPRFDDAVNACEAGASLSYGASNLASLTVLKTIKGEATPADWALLQKRMQQVTMTPSNIGVAWYLARYSNGDSRIDARNVMPIIDIVSKREGFRPEEYAGFGYYASRMKLDGDAYRYYMQAVQSSPPHSSLPSALIADLKAEGRTEWASRLEALARSRSNPPTQ